MMNVDITTTEMKCPTQLSPINSIVRVREGKGQGGRERSQSEKTERSRRSFVTLLMCAHRLGETSGYFYDSPENRPSFLKKTKSIDKFFRKKQRSRGVKMKKRLISDEGGRDKVVMSIVKPKSVLKKTKSIERRKRSRSNDFTVSSAITSHKVTNLLRMFLLKRAAPEGLFPVALGSSRTLVLAPNRRFAYCLGNESPDDSNGDEKSILTVPRGVRRLVQVHAGRRRIVLLTSSGIILTTSEENAYEAKPLFEDGNDHFVVDVSMLSADDSLVYLDVNGSVAMIESSVSAYQTVARPIGTYGHCVIQVSAGEKHVLLRTTTGRVMSFGSGEYGQLGLGSTLVAKEPALIEIPSDDGDGEDSDVRVAQVSAGSAHSLVLTRSGCVLAFGKGAHGRLGLGDSLHNRLRPTYVMRSTDANDGVPSRRRDMGAAQISAGDTHSLVLTNERDVLSFGCGTFGQLGLGDAQDRHRPHPVPLRAHTSPGQLPSRVIAGCLRSVVVMDNGSIVGFGRNDRNQLGRLHQADCLFCPSKV